MTIEDKGRNIIEARASGVANTTRNLIYSSLNHRNRRPPHFQPPRMRLHEPISKWLIGNVICVTLVMPRWLETNLHVKAINEVIEAITQSTLPNKTDYLRCNFIRCKNALGNLHTIMQLDVGYRHRLLIHPLRCLQLSNKSLPGCTCNA